MTEPERAGSRWRLLAHEMVGPTGSGDAYHISSDRTFGGGTGADTVAEVDGRVFRSTHTELPVTDLDELVVGDWLHVEQMDTGLWWINIGGVTVDVRADPQGKPTSVTVHGPGDYDAPQPGVTYQCVWTNPS